MRCRVQACVLTRSHCRTPTQAERDCPVLANTCSEAARAFYLRNGFAEVGRQPMLIGKRQHWWMVFPAQCRDVPVR